MCDEEYKFPKVLKMYILFTCGTVSSRELPNIKLGNSILFDKVIQV